VKKVNLTFCYPLLAVLLDDARTISENVVQPIKRRSVCERPMWLGIWLWACSCSIVDTMARWRCRRVAKVCARSREICWVSLWCVSPWLFLGILQIRADAHWGWILWIPGGPLKAERWLHIPDDKNNLLSVFNNALASGVFAKEAVRSQSCRRLYAVISLGSTA